MFYLKTEHEGKQIEVDIYGDDIYTTCFRCFKEFQVDEDLLAQVLEGDGDLCSTSLSCGQEKCIEKKLTRIK